MTDLFDDLHPPADPTPDQTSRAQARISSRRTSRRRRKLGFGGLVVVLAIAAGYAGLNSLRDKSTVVHSADGASAVTNDMPATSSPDTSDPAQAFWGERWQLTRLVEEGMEQDVPASPEGPIVLDTTRPLTVQFKWCNDITVVATVQNGQLDTTGIYTTAAGCSKEAYALDDSLSELLQSEPTVETSDATLTLTKGDTFAVFRLE